MSKPLHTALILFIFAITGSTAAYIGKPILTWLGVSKANVGLAAYIGLYILIITPLYQVILLSYAALFGQFQYFWTKQKRLFARIAGRKTEE